MALRKSSPRRDRIEEAAPTRPNCKPSIRPLRIASGRGQAAISEMVLGLLCGLWAPLAPAVTEDDKLTASDLSAGDYFGYSVAASGTTVVVGAQTQDPAGGAAYVYDCSTLPCTLLSKLTASDGVAGDLLGQSVAVNGSTVVVGAPANDDAGASSGSAYVFDLTSCGASCNESAKLTASDAAAFDEFGYSVAVDGTTVVVGARFDDNPGPDSGSAYVFDLANCGTSACTERSKLTASDAAAGDYFGVSIAISGDTVVVGTPADNDGGSVSGSAYVFDLAICPGGSVCKQSAKLTASDGAADDNFGVAVAVDGTLAVVGAPYDDDGGSASGAAYVFDLGNCGANCTESAKLTASDGAADDNFGIAVAVSGTTTVVGAWWDDEGGSDSGSAYRFDLTSCGAACTESAKLSPSDAAAGDWFGRSVAVSGSTSVVGAPRDDDWGTSSGSAYAFGLGKEPAVLDIDASGTVDALTDGLLVIRYLFGFTGSTLTNGAVGPGCTRCTAPAIESYLSGLMP